MALKCAAKIAIGIDVGTSSVKATAITSDGEIHSRQSRPYTSTIPLDGAVEQNPDDWWQAIGEALSLLLPSLPHVDRENTTIGLTGQMHTSVLRDERGALIRPAILWSDKRASAECTELSAAIPGIADMLGNPLMPAFSIAHIAWLRSHEPESFGRIGSILVPKDDVRRRFGAGETTEPSDASGTGLLDTRTDEWSNRVLETAGLKRHMMPVILPSHAVSGRICALPPGSLELRRLLGVPVVGGAGDQAAQAVALGVTAPGQLGISIGTSGVAFRALNEPAPRSFRHAYDNRWLALNSTHAAGLALSWFALISQQAVPDLAEATVHAETAPFFLPYLQGHRDKVGAPGALIDLDVRHGAPDIAYAVMEGVAYELVRLAESVGDGHIPPGSVCVGGGGGRSERWRSLLANALDRSVVFSDRDSSFGAARIAAEAAGWFQLFAENDRIQASKTDPDPSTRALTDARHSRFIQLAALLAPADQGDAS